MARVGQCFFLVDYIVVEMSVPGRLTRAPITLERPFLAAT